MALCQCWRQRSEKEKSCWWVLPWDGTFQRKKLLKPWENPLSPNEHLSMNNILQWLDLFWVWQQSHLSVKCKYRRQRFAIASFKTYILLYYYLLLNKTCVFETETFGCFFTNICSFWTWCQQHTCAKAKKCGQEYIRHCAASTLLLTKHVKLLSNSFFLRLKSLLKWSLKGLQACVIVLQMSSVTFHRWKKKEKLVVALVWSRLRQFIHVVLEILQCGTKQQPPAWQIMPLLVVWSCLTGFVAYNAGL